MAASLEEHIAGIGTVNRHMTHSAGLVFRRLVVRRSGRALNRECMALQAQEVDLADPQQPRIGRSMRGMAATAAFGLYRHMFKDKRTLLVGMALVADSISAGQRFDLAQRGRAVHIVAIHTLDQPLIYAMVIGLCEIRFLSDMAAIAELGLGLYQQMLWLLRLVRRVAIQAAHVVAGVHGA